MDHFNSYQLKHFAGIVADTMGISLPEGYAKGIKWVSDILKSRAGGTCDRAVLYHADAVGMYMWQQYTDLFAPVYRNTTLSLPFISTVSSFTPVAHASMYTGLDPKDHGIQSYTRPQLECSTLFDVLIAQGKRVAILAQDDSTFLHIFAGRELDYFEEPNAICIQEKALELIESDKYDVISIHTFDYDNAAHFYGPESKEGINAIALEAEGFERIAKLIRSKNDGRRTLLTYSPDHGQHPVGSIGDEPEAEGVDTSKFKGMHGTKKIEDMNILHFFGTI